MKAILFDVDDTLFSTTEFARHAREKAVDAMVEMGIEAPAEEVLTELLEVIREFGSNYGQHFDKLLDRLPPHQRRDVNPALIVAAGMTSLALFGNYTYFGSSSAHLPHLVDWVAVGICGVVGGLMGGIFSRVLVLFGAGFRGRWRRHGAGRPSRGVSPAVDPDGCRDRESPARPEDGHPHHHGRWHAAPRGACGKMGPHPG